MKTILQGGDNSLHHCNLEHEFIPLPQAMKIQRMEKIKAQRCESTFRIVDGHLSSDSELEKKHKKYKGRIVLRGDFVKDDSGSYAVFTEQGS